MVNPIQTLQVRLGVQPDGDYGPISGAALWAAVRSGDLSTDDPIYLAARAAIAAGYDECSPREPLEGEAGPAGSPSPTGPLQAPGGAIIIDGRPVPVPPGLPLIVVQYRMGDLGCKPRRQRPCQVILHHDAGDNARSTFDVLLARGLSTHFCTDDNGVVLQFADPARDRGSHALGHLRLPGGGRQGISFNSRSIGIDISNPVIPDGAAGRRDHGRPLIADRVHKMPYKGLGCYPVQVDATIALLRSLCNNSPDIEPTQYRTDLEWPGDIDSSTPGIWGHLHINRGKVDPWGFPWHRLAEVRAT